MNKPINNPSKILVAMSGGVDSSVAAFLLLKQGWQVIGATMDTGYGEAPEQAKAVCAQLGIEHHIIDIKNDFRHKVIEPFVNRYLAGQTPNPCVECNAELKFSVFLPLMEKLGIDKMATGHYCAITQNNGIFQLHKAAAGNKDQTYFLYRLGQDILSRCVFPLGEITKEQVRDIAATAGLISSAQKDSFDICFIEDGDYRSCIRSYAQIPPTPGEIIDMDGKVVGEHQGLMAHTIGQRHGINVALGYPAYAVGMDISGNRLIMGPKEALYKSEAQIDNINWLSGIMPVETVEAQVCIRYRSPAVQAQIYPEGEGAKIKFSQPVWAPAPGQSAVFYDDDILLGGGYIV